jgi:hypothetical protein
MDMNAQIEGEIVEKYKSGKYTCTALGIEYQTGYQNISKILRQNGIAITKSKMLYRKLADHKEEIIQKYLEGYNSNELASIYNSKNYIILRLLKTEGVNIRTKPEIRTYSLDSSFFKSIDNSTKAYILGLLYADGYNSNKVMSLTLQSPDREVLDYFKKALNYDGPTRIDKRWGTCIVEIGSRSMSRDLTKLGCLKCKSLILDFPNLDIVPKNFMGAFILGYFDGDGWITITTTRQLAIGFCGSHLFIKKLQLFLKEELGLNGSLRSKVNHSELLYCGNKSAKRLGEYLFAAHTFSMARKRSKFVQHFN